MRTGVQQVQAGSNKLEVIEFELLYTGHNNEEIRQSFGINVSKVREIIRLPKFTAMPKSPDSVPGIFNLRNRIIPAVDLRYVLYGSHNTSEDAKVIVAEFNSMQFGFIVNAVERIHQFPWSQVEAPDALQDFDEEHSSIIGIIKHGDKNILMVDVEKIIADVNPRLALDHGSTENTLFGNGRVALTADDSPTIRRMLSERLKLAGFTIESYRDGQDAWNALQAKVGADGKSLKGRLDVIVTDIEMPQMDGYTLVRQIKEHPAFAGIPVLIFSSIISDDLRHMGEKVGADAQLAKPQISMLLDTLKSVLEPA